MFYTSLIADSRSTPSPSRANPLLASLAAVALLALAVPAFAGEPATDAATSAYEVDYMKFVTDHHGMGVEMADIALDKAVSARLNDLSSTIKQDQTQEIDQVKGYLSEWYGQTYDPMLTPQDMMDLDMLRALDGREFDIGVSEMFIEHHRGIIARSEEALTRVEHPELMAVAQGIITKQSAEIPVFESIIAEAGGGTVIPLPAPVAIGALGLAGTAVATWTSRRRSM